MNNLKQLIDVGNAGYSGRFTQDMLDRFMLVGDPLADRAVAALHERAYERTAAKLPAVRDSAAGGEPAAIAFLAHLEQRPKWVDEGLIAHAQRLSLIYYRPMQMSLMHSLFAGALFARATLVTQSTGRLGGNPGTRIKETTAFVAAVLQPGGLEPGALGFETAVRVRLLHSSIRAWLVRSPGFTEDFVGAPIDQTMLAMTLGLFSYLNIRSLARLGLRLTEKDQRALHHMWRYVGWLLGVDDALLTQNVGEEKRLWSALVAHQTFPDSFGEDYLTDAVAAVAALAKTSRDIKPFIRSLYLHLSGPAWYGVKGLEPWDKRLRLVIAAGGAVSVINRWLPSSADAMETRGRKAFAHAVELAQKHDFGVTIETPMNIEKHAQFMKRLSHDVRKRFSYISNAPQLRTTHSVGHNV